MGAFTPFKRNAKPFNYIPRHYDPAKEAREERREELSGRRSDTSDEEYVPGKYIRTQRAARERRAQRSAYGSIKMWITIAAVAVIALMGSMLYSRLLDIFGTSERVQVQAEYEEFNPYAPITIVPNDYDDSKSE